MLEQYILMLIPLNGLGTECKKGTECPTYQVCGTSRKCAFCEAGFQPDDKNEKCIPSMFYQFLSTAIKDNFNTSKWPRYRM